MDQSAEVIKQPFFLKTPNNIIKKVELTIEGTKTLDTLASNIKKKDGTDKFNMLNLAVIKAAQHPVAELFKVWKTMNPSIEQVLDTLEKSDLNYPALIIEEDLQNRLNIQVGFMNKHSPEDRPIIREFQLIQQASDDSGVIIKQLYPSSTTNDDKKFNPLSTSDNNQLSQVASASQLNQLVLSECSALLQRLNNSGNVVAVSHNVLEVLTQNFNDSPCNNQRGRLGSGGFGVVYLGRWGNLTIAVKRLTLSALNAQCTQTELIEKQFKAEIESLARVHHENLINLLGYCTDGPSLCILYEYISNGALDQRLTPAIEANRKMLPVLDRIRISVEIARALTYLHSFKPSIIHRDVKSSNILLDDNLIAKLADFGLAHCGPSGDVTSLITSVKLGSTPYVPIEYLKQGKVSIRLDAYSFGVVLFEILTGLLCLDNHREEQFLVDHMKECCECNGYNVQPLLDTRDGPWHFEIAVSMATVAFQLTEENKRLRSTVESILPIAESWLSTR